MAKKDIADVNKLRMLRWGNFVDDPGEEVCLMQSAPKKETGSSEGQSQKRKIRVWARIEAAMQQILNMKYEAKESRHLYELEKTKKNTLEPWGGMQLYWRFDFTKWDSLQTSVLQNYNKSDFFKKGI